MFMDEKRGYAALPLRVSMLAERSYRGHDAKAVAEQNFPFFFQKRKSYLLSIIDPEEPIYCGGGVLRGGLSLPWWQT